MKPTRFTIRTLMIAVALSGVACVVIPAMVSTWRWCRAHDAVMIGLLRAVEISCLGSGVFVAAVVIRHRTRAHESQ
jgi:hypothetical protein